MTDQLPIFAGIEDKARHAQVWLDLPRAIGGPVRDEAEGESVKNARCQSLAGVQGGRIGRRDQHWPGHWASGKGGKFDVFLFISSSMMNCSGWIYDYF